MNKFKSVLPALGLLAAVAVAPAQAALIIQLDFVSGTSVSEQTGTCQRL